jgi:hypothetical protein
MAIRYNCDICDEEKKKEEVIECDILVKPKGGLQDILLRGQLVCTDCMDIYNKKANG